MPNSVDISFNHYQFGIRECYKFTIRKGKNESEIVLRLDGIDREGNGIVEVGTSNTTWLGVCDGANCTECGQNGVGVENVCEFEG